MKKSAFNLRLSQPWLPPKILLIVKLIVIIMTTCLMQVSAASFAQKITFSKKGATLERIFTEIRKQTGYYVVYAENKIDKQTKLDVNFKNTELKNVLDVISNSQNLEYSLDERNISFKPKEKSYLEKIIARFQQIEVRGRVVDQDGKPLPNASIRVKGKNTVINTNQNGEFEIKGVADDAVLLISYVGFRTLELPLKDAVMPLEIKLNVATGELEEVKVVYNTGYQELNKERATGSFVQLSNKDINRGVSTNILDRIINQTNSLRNETLGASSISIRGLSTLNANAKPLIVIDGFPYDESILDLGPIVSVKNINPNDVESITILRDAAAASIWGARAANGVIVITTKKGKYNEHTQVDIVSSLNIISKPELFKANIMSSADVIDYQRNLFATGYYDSYNGPFTSTYTYPMVPQAIEILLAQKRGALSQADAESQLAQLAKHDVRNDINKYLIRTASNQQYNLNVSGGSDKMAYYGSMGYDRNLSSSIGDAGNRFTLRLDNTYRPIKNLELNTYISYTQIRNENNGVGYSSFLANGNNAMAPYTMLADNAGNPLHVPTRLRTAYIDTITTKGLLDWHYRPIDEIKNGNNITNSFNARFGGELRYTIIQGISVRFKGQYEKGITSINNYNSTKMYSTRSLINTFMFLNSTGMPQYPVPNGGILDYSQLNSTSWDIRSVVTVNRQWGIHGINAIIGFDAKESLNSYNQNKKYGYDIDKLTYVTNMDYKSAYTIRPGNFGSTISDGGGFSGRLNRFLSYYGNAAYSLFNKYTISASARIDASNFFGIKANLRYVPLWSAGVKWDLLKEKFLNLKSLSTLNLRLTYGYNGNLDNRATSLPTIIYSSGSSIYNNSQQSAGLTNPPNPGLTWEKVSVINAGLDFGLIGNRIAGAIDLYEKKSDDLIGAILLDQTTGFLQYNTNYASVKVKGIDLSVNALVINSAIKLNTNLSFSWNIDRVTDYQIQNILTTSVSNRVTNLNPIVGDPRYTIYSYKWGGLDPVNGNPMGVVNGEKVPYLYAIGNTGSEQNMKIKDLVYHGRAMAPYFGNLINTLSYKGLSLTFNLVYKFGYYFRRPSIDYARLLGQWGGHEDYAKRWKKPGDELITNVPSMPVIQDSRYESFTRYSEILVERGDQIRLQDLKLAFDINNINFKKLPFKSANIFLYANNIGLLWRANKLGIDPDAISNNNIPNPRNWAIGLNFKL
ncbi:SusC/RagA family TonB-linked outer membrane protein [Pedobacter ginsengisoli]|uniref:SusC/RagA family TonB-linked outer membrane protein n=1 Tax=Pedobacter ginsengisoli TaxID=363852 RepID=UPI002550F45E|nr:SusC/RagA family TonB-linked outer membrane protein [Pedobacter ginsengisoli]